MTPSILVIEDDDDLSTALCNALSDMGFQVSRVMNGLEGLQALERQVFDVILLDWMMPTMDGSEFLATLGDAHQEVKIIVMSADQAIVQKTRGLRCGAVLPKPIDIDVLGTAVGRILQ